MNKTAAEANIMLESIATNSQQFGSRIDITSASVNEVGYSSHLEQQITALTNYNVTVGKNPLQTTLVHNVGRDATSKDENSVETVAALTGVPEHGKISNKDQKPKKGRSSTT